MINFKSPLSNDYNRVVVYDSKNNFVESFPICPSWSASYFCDFVVTLSKGFPDSYFLDIE